MSCTSNNVLKNTNNHCSYQLSDTIIGYQNDVLSVYKAVVTYENGIYAFNMTVDSFTTVCYKDVALIETTPLLCTDITVGDVLLNSGRIIIVAEKDTINDNTFNCIYNNYDRVINVNFNPYGDTQLLLKLYMPSLFTTEALQHLKSNTNIVKQIYYQEVFKILQNQ